MCKLHSLFFLLFSIFSYIKLSKGSQPISKTITVDLNGLADFNTIQDAINSIPDSNNEWIKIHINQGTYTEKVTIPYQKSYIILEGDGSNETFIQWGDHEPIIRPDLDADIKISWNTATFLSLADNVILSALTFKNTYQDLDNPQNAVAALINGDKTSVYGCSFIGIQDTLSDLCGRHYFRDCSVEGIVDFIFGYGQSIYEGCTLNTVSSGVPVGYVTAQGRQQSNDPNGFVFKNCHIGGSAEAYLGRGWGNYSRVLFYQTYMENIIVPKGWIDWRAGYGGNFTTFAESDCIGPGSNTSGRVKWEKELSDDDVKKLTSISTFINSDNWLDQQPNDYGYTSD
ncbi:probable pectinesterase 55 [Asparagus officinalis]|uniref:probable pectinesterase 55 n=1 Tax=Asparagus officinalis TaxID=4686 RepID=UPI00098E1C87|nr:probable pectinesterase 55 [Asparagus officinalis]